ncbi:MAG: histidinol-phosphate transaminase [Pseudomonadota bacterium]
MNVSNIIKRARKTVLDMKPYQSARELVKASDDMILLDANECAYEPFIGAKGYSRYAEQQPKGMMDALCRLYDVSSRNIIAARGADEVIEIITRTFCESGKDNIIITPPTFPMYAHSARLQEAGVREVPLTTPNFELDIEGIKKQIDGNTKLIYLCSPNNPTANLIPQKDILEVCKIAGENALVILDEIYIEYADAPSCIPLIDEYPNLIVLRSLSKAYASAGIRSGYAVAHADIIMLLRKVLAIYPTPVPVAETVQTILSDKNLKRLQDKISETIQMREHYAKELEKLDCVERVYPSDANFFFVKFKNADDIIKRCIDNRIILRDQSYQKDLDNHVRFSIGAKEEMETLFTVLKGGARTRIQNARTAHITRNTNETAIDVRINLDEKTPIHINTGIGFYDHMLDQLAKHGGFSMQLECSGDLEIDPHHTVEDCAIAIGQALKEALGDKRGVGRYGFTVPMDETLAEAAIDLSGRFHLEFNADFPDEMVGELPVTLVPHVFRSLGENLGATIHISAKGDDTHHMVEGAFKAFARALGQAIRKDGDALPSTKGML